MPSLSGFIKANPGTYWSGDALKRMPGQTGINLHTHILSSYDTDIRDIKVSAEVKMATAIRSDRTDYHNTLHVGSGNEDPTGVTALTADSIDI